MLSLILYCGLLSSFVVSKHFNIKDESELDINTTLSTLASTTIPVSKDCVLEMNENVISQIVELFNSNLVNVVIIHISFSNSSQSERVLSDFHLTLWTNAGGEVLFALENIFSSVVPWTLEVGIRNFALNIKRSRKECVKREKNIADFILKDAQNIFLKISMTTNHKVCSSLKVISTEKVFKSFCKITKLFSTIRLDSKCRDYIPWLTFHAFMSLFALLMGLMFLLVVIVKSNRNPKFLRYYTLEESVPLPFAISWESQVDIVFFIARFVFISICLYSYINLFLRFLLGQYMCSSSLRLTFFIFVCLLFYRCLSTLFYRCCYSFHTFISNTVNRLKPWIFRVKLVLGENNKYCCVSIKLVQVMIFFVYKSSPHVCTAVLILTIFYGAFSLMLGLFINLIYFISYFAFFSVLTFYCHTYCKTTEKKYFVLKRLIYEACRETQGINNGCIPDRHLKPNEKVIPVVSKELYEKIREQLLPYNKNLLYFRLKMCWSFVFSYGIFKFASMQNEFAVGFQAVTTASLGVIPHILNMIASKVYEKRNKASHEKLKLNVKYMVEELIREDPKLAKTVKKYIDIMED